MLAVGKSVSPATASTPLQSSSTPLPATSVAPGWIFALRSLQSPCSGVKPSWSASMVPGVDRVGAAAVLIDAVARHVVRARMHAGAAVIAITLIGGEAIVIVVEVADGAAERDDDVDRRSRRGETGARWRLAEDRSFRRNGMCLSRNSTHRKSGSDDVRHVASVCD